MLPATEFTPLLSALGGALIGLSAVLLMALNGRIAGISGILGQVLARRDPGAERLLFLAGLVLGPLVVALLTGGIPQHLPTSDLLLAAAGLLVGFGSALGQGCTSGHGVCGLARLSPRSLVATLVFMAVAALTVFLMRHVGG